MPRRKPVVSIPTRSWETADHPWEGTEQEQQNSQSESEHSDRGIDKSEDKVFPETGEAAGDMFLKYLLAEYYAGHVSAKTVGVLCFWAARAGAKGELVEFAKRPDASSGDFPEP